ncbi:hypothetical protein Q5H89_13200 [Hymenobacter sp. CA2-7]|nr:hypothetical protein [Hymenobacter sp. CA2-7]
MNLRFRLLSALKNTRWGALVALPVLLAGCRHESVVPNPVADYFPVVVGTYRTYAVTDSVWTNARVSVTSYQLRERVAEQFTDAAGQPAYRLVRSRRATASAGWADDSVLIVQPSARAVLLTQNNVRTVELIYPARAGKGWNDSAFTASPDTIISLKRFYGPSVGGPYTVPAFSGQPAKTYDNTVATYKLFAAQDNDGLRRRSGYQQVYAQGVGLVVRRRYGYALYTTNPADGTETYYKDVQRGIAHREVLLETGTI